MGVASALGRPLPQDHLTEGTSLNRAPLKFSPEFSGSAVLSLANARPPSEVNLKPLTRSDNLVLVFGSGEIPSEFSQDFLPLEPVVNYLGELQQNSPPVACCFIILALGRPSSIYQPDGCWIEHSH